MPMITSITGAELDDYPTDDDYKKTIQDEMELDEDEIEMTRNFKLSPLKANIPTDLLKAIMQMSMQDRFAYLVDQIISLRVQIENMKQQIKRMQ